jgi:uncharacterized protein YndB with AHSA1/START domain
MATIPDVLRKVTVAAPIERAFRVFTDGIASWWPEGFQIGEEKMATLVLEPRTGGRWFERGETGAECDWGRVLVWEPPHRLVVTWQINGEWQYDPDPAHASELELRFIEDGPRQTTVELTHRLLGRLASAETLRASVAGEAPGSMDGWAGLLQLFSASAAEDGAA